MVKAIAIITVSDTCFKESSKDTSGPTLAEFVKQLFPNANLHTIIVPDERDIVERELKYFADEANVDLVLTTGGTGLSCRDVTPDATRAVIEREVPGISVAMTIDSLQKTPMAMLSRSVAGIRKKTLIINFPGSKKAVTECFEVIKPVLSHAVGVLDNDFMEIRSTHEKIQAPHHCHHMGSSVDVTKVAFRPRESPYPMLEVSEAFAVIDEVIQKAEVGAEYIHLGDSVGRVLVETLFAKEALPPFPASVKDGTVLDAALIGVLAGSGYLSVPVRKKPKVALMSTGNELQEPSEPQLKPAHIRDSNRIMLKVLLREQGYDAIDCGIVKDDPTDLVKAISSALSKCDFLVCTGGVSMGERDLLKPVLIKDFGATLHFGRVRMKPGDRGGRSSAAAARRETGGQ